MFWNLGKIADSVRRCVHRSLLGSFHHLHLPLQYLHEGCSIIGDLFWMFLLQITFLVATYATVYLMFFKFRSTYMRESDTFRIELLIIPSVVLAFVINHDYAPFELLWTFSIYLEAVAILPQLFLLQSTGSAEVTNCIHVYICFTIDRRDCLRKKWVLILVKHSPFCSILMPNWKTSVSPYSSSHLDANLFSSLFQLFLLAGYHCSLLVCTGFVPRSLYLQLDLPLLHRGLFRSNRCRCWNRTDCSLCRFLLSLRYPRRQHSQGIGTSDLNEPLSFFFWLSPTSF